MALRLGGAGWTVLLLLLLVGAAPVARAEAPDAPTCAALPLRVLDAEAEEAAPLELAFREEVASVARREGLQLAAQQDVAQALAALQADCAESEACLAELARRVRTRCVVLVSLAAFSPVRRVTARVVDARGQEVPEGTVREMGSGGRGKATARALLSTALARLPWQVMRTLPLPKDDVPPAPPQPQAVAAAPPALPAPALTPQPVPTNPPATWQRPVGLGLMGAGLLAAVTGGVVHAGAASDAQRLQTWQASPGDLDAKRGLRESLNARQVLVPALFGGGAAAVAAGAALFLLAPGQSPSAVPMVSVGPGQLSVGVTSSF